MTDVPDFIVGGKPPRSPFRVDSLPLIARLCRAGFHRYRRRWAKRLFKKPARLVFDVAYHGLKLGGLGTMVLDLPLGERRLDFDARKVHFGGVYHNAYAEGYEPEVAALLETVLSGDRVFFDIGANWGYFALYAATIEGYSGPIHAFEPIAETFSDLESLTAQAGLGGRVHCHRLALSDRDSTGTMAFDSVNTGLARLIKDSEGGRGATGGCPPDNNGGGRPRDPRETTEVRLKRLDGLDLPAPWLIKLDVETHELQALRGAETLLTREKPFVVFENWKERHDPQGTLGPLRYLEELGYVLYLPCWQFRDEGGCYLWPAPAAPRPSDRRDLALLRFPAEGRFQFADQINAFACHRDRVIEFAKAFSAAGRPD